MIRPGEVGGRLSVTHVTAPAPLGGLESVVTSLAIGMAARGHRIRVVALLDSSPSCIPFADLPEAGVDLVEVRMTRRGLGAEGRHLAELLRASPGIIHSHGARADRASWVAHKRTGSAVVATSHGYLGGGWKNRLSDWLDQRLLARFDSVVAVSRPLAQLLAGAGVPKGRLAVIPNARRTVSLLDRATARARLGISDDRLVCGWVGRLSAEKGPDVMLEAMARLPDSWTLSFVGTGPEEAALQAQAERLGITSRIRWHGAIPDAAGLLRAFDLVALSSRTEGSPMVVLEAMAAGVPLVVPRVGGIPEMLSDAEAVLVPPNDPERLATAIAASSPADPAVAARADRARVRSEGELSADQWLDRYQQLYHELSLGKAVVS